MQLGFDLTLRGLCTPTHRPLLASHRRYDRAAIDDRLGERALVGKWDGWALDDACERTRILGGLIHTPTGPAAGCGGPAGESSGCPAGAGGGVGAALEKPGAGRP